MFRHQTVSPLCGADFSSLERGLTPPPNFMPPLRGYFDRLLRQL